jgi:hypothetical protein
MWRNVYILKMGLKGCQNCEESQGEPQLELYLLFFNFIFQILKLCVVFQAAYISLFYSLHFGILHMAI